jgi:hypothetical protein
LRGDDPGAIGRIEPVIWNQPGKRDVVEATFVPFSNLEMTGRIVTLDQQQWHALVHAKLESFFYLAMLWGKDPTKVVADAEILLRRARPAQPPASTPASRSEEPMGLSAA